MPVISSRLTLICVYLFLCSCSLLKASAQQAQSEFGFDPAHFSAYVKKVQTSKDPSTIALRHQIADGPNALKREKALALRAGFLLEPVKKSMPPDSQNAAVACAQLQALLKAKPLRLPEHTEGMSARYSYKPEEIAAVRTILAGGSDVMTLVHQIADRPVYMPKSSSSDTEGLYPLAGMREAARLLMTESYLLATQGKTQEAVANQVLVYRIAQHAASGKTLINYLVAIAIDSIGTSGMSSILRLSENNPKACVIVKKALMIQHPEVSYKQAMLGETAYGLREITRLRAQNPDSLEQLTAITPIAPHASPHLAPQETQLYHNFMDAIAADYLRKMRFAVSGVVIKPSPTQSQNPIRMTSDLIVPIFGKEVTYQTQSRAQAAVVIAASDILASHEKTGHWPNTLLHPIIDPFSGKPLVYRREGTHGFVVYSVGDSGKYDGAPRTQRFAPAEAVFRYPIANQTPAM